LPCKLNQKYFYRRSLHDDTMQKYFSFKPPHLPLLSSMQIHVWTPAGVLLTLNDLSSWDSVANLQSRLAVLAGIVPEQQRLTFRGRRLETSRVLVEYGIHEHHQGIITIEFEEEGIPCVSESNVLRLSDSFAIGNSLLDSPLLNRLPPITGPECGSKHLLAGSEASTCLPSECTSDCGDAESCGASVLLQDLPPIGSSGDPFIDANSAHVTYLLMRRQRLEAAGLGVRTLCR